MSTKHPKFQRPNMSIMRRVKDKWRHPRGIDNKQARKVKWAGATVNIGYQGAAKTRNNHPQGKQELYVRNLSEIAKFKGKMDNFVVRMQATLSKRSKEIIRQKCKALKVHVVN